MDFEYERPNAEATPPILGAPVEILQRITAHLPTLSLTNLRLTCRALERSVFLTFAQEFFSRKQFMITEDSLQALTDIAKSRFGQHVRFVQIGLDHFREEPGRPLSDPAKERILREHYGRTIALWSSGAHRSMLIEAFTYLKNLSGVVIRDFNSRRRSRDGPGTEWTSYGSTTLFQETGVSLPQSRERRWDTRGTVDRYCSEVFLAVVNALAAAKAKPASVEVMCRQDNHLLDFAFLVPKTSLQDVTVLLNGLQKLHLELDLTWRRPTNWNAQNNTQTTPLQTPSLLQFLALTPNLKDLRINEGRIHDDEVDIREPAVKHLLDSLSRAALPHLDKISLGFLCVKMETLLDLVRRFSSISSLELWKMYMVCSIEDAPLSDSGFNFWLWFLEHLGTIPDLHLTHLKLGALRQHWTDGPGSGNGNASDTLTFSDTDDPAVVEYNGTNWRHWVTQLKQVRSPRAMPVPPPPNWGAEPDLNLDDENDEDDEDDAFDISLHDMADADPSDNEDPLDILELLMAVGDN